MKEYAVQKQLIPDERKDTTNWAKRQIWVYKLNSEDDIDEFDSLEEAESRRDELDSEDPSHRVYRVVRRVDKFEYEVIK